MESVDSKRNRSKRVRTRARLKVLYVQIRAVVGSILFLGLACAAGSILFFSWIADEVLEGDTRIFDETVRNFVHGFASNWLTFLMELITLLGSTLFLSVVCIGVFVIFINKKWKRAAILLMTTMAGAVILNFVLKISFERARPVPFFETPLPESYSFPSGHSLYGVCFYVGLAWLTTSRLSNRPLKISIWIFAVFLSLLIGLSRVYLGVHYPSDVVAGFAAATVWLSAVISIDYIIQKRLESFKINEF